MYGHTGAVQILLMFLDSVWQLGFGILNISPYYYIHDPTSFPMGLVMLYIFEKPVPNSFLTLRPRNISPIMPLQLRKSYLVHEHIFH